MMSASGGNSPWLELQRYPGTLLLYALGLGALETDRLRFLGRMFATTVRRQNREDLTAIQLLPPFCLFTNGGQVAQFLEGMDRHYAPLNDWLHEALRQHTKRLISNEDRYTFVFDKLEVLIALSFVHHAQRTKERYWAPPGAFEHRHQTLQRVLQEIEESISKLKDESPFVKCGIFGETAEICTQGLEAFKEFVEKLSWQWH